MKRQVVGIRSSDELDSETSDSKRIKLLNNEVDTSNVRVDFKEAKSAEMLQNNGSYNHDNADHSPIISANGSAYENHTSKQCSENNLSVEKDLSINENIPVENENNGLSINHNGSCDEVVINVSSSDSVIVSESCYAESHINSDTSEVKVPDNTESKSGHSNYANHIDLHNSDSTDSFQSENFEVTNCTDVSENQVQKSSSSPGKDGCQGIESKIGYTLHKSIDVENLLLSHLEVTQLEGHPDVIFSVAADEDFVLSSSGDTTIKVWSMDHSSIISNFSGHKDSVTSVLLLNQKQSDSLKKKLAHPEVSRIAITGSLDCHLKVWSVTEGHEIASVYTFNGITCLGYLECGSYVVVGTEGGKIELWDIASAKAIQSVHAHEDSVTDIKVKDSNVYSVSTDGTVKVWVFEDDEIYPVYTRKRKEITQNKTFGPTQWKSIAVSDNIMYLGDSTNNLKVLDWRAGHLRLFRNQTLSHGVCENVVTEKDMLLSTYYDSSSDTAGINIWRIPDMTYICTLTGEVQDICSIAVVQKENILRIVSGGHQLLVWDFDFAKPPNKESQDGFYVCEMETLGSEISEKLVEVGKGSSAAKTAASIADSKNSSNKWCNVM